MFLAFDERMTFPVDFETLQGVIKAASFDKNLKSENLKRVIAKLRTLTHRHDKDKYTVLLSVASMPQSGERDNFLWELLEKAKLSQKLFTPDD